MQPKEKGKSIGKELLSMSLKALSEQGFTEATVWVLSKNKIARDFYEHQGFVTDGAEKDYQGLPEVRYRKSIKTAT